MKSSQDTNTPPAFAELRKQQKETMSESTRRAKAESDRNDAEEDRLYNKLDTALRPYNHSVLDGHEVELTKDRVKRQIKLSVDGKLWLTFATKREYHSCSCENVCEHETSSSLSFYVIQHLKQGDLACYFPCYEADLAKPQNFAVAMAKMMDDYNWESRL